MPRWELTKIQFPAPIPVIELHSKDTDFHLKWCYQLIFFAPGSTNFYPYPGKRITPFAQISQPGI